MITGLFLILPMIASWKNLRPGETIQKLRPTD